MRDEECRHAAAAAALPFEAPCCFEVRELWPRASALGTLACAHVTVVPLPAACTSCCACFALFARFTPIFGQRECL